MIQHRFFNIEWIGFNSSWKRVAGVYLIGDCYVGSSIHIRRRILNHLALVYSTTNNEFYNFGHYNESVQNYVSDCIINNKPIRVTLLSNDRFDEEKFHKIYGIEIKKGTRVLNHVNKGKILNKSKL